MIRNDPGRLHFRQLREAKGISSLKYIGGRAIAGINIYDGTDGKREGAQTRCIPSTASRSAASLPGMLLWPFTQLNSTCTPFKDSAVRQASNAIQISWFFTGVPVAVLKPLRLHCKIQYAIPFKTYCGAQRHGASTKSSTGNGSIRWSVFVFEGRKASPKQY